MQIQETFPILKDYIYLNTAYSGLLSSNIAKWRRAHDEDFMKGGGIFRANNLEVIEKLRFNLSSTFSSKLSNTFLTSNFSIGFNAILNGLTLEHRFLILEEDYPSVSFPVKSLGFDFLEVQIQADFENDIVKAIEKFKPTVFAFSMVQYISGLRMQSKFIKKLKSNFPDLLLIADGTQFIGTGAFNFEESGLDALIGSGYKWLLGGYGNGYLFLSDVLRNLIYEKGKTVVLPSNPMLNGRDYLSLILEPGHLDSLNFGSLNESLNYLNAIGLDTIEDINNKTCNKARLMFNQKGLLADWIIERPEQSTIISVPLKKETIDKLEKANILFAARGAGTRISFHFYNTLEDLDRFMELLD